MFKTKILTLGIHLQYNIQNIHEPNNFEYFHQKITNSNIVVYNFQTTKQIISLRFKSKSDKTACSTKFCECFRLFLHTRLSIVQQDLIYTLQNSIISLLDSNTDCRPKNMSSYFIEIGLSYLMLLRFQLDIKLYPDESLSHTWTQSIGVRANPDSIIRLNK